MNAHPTDLIPAFVLGALGSAEASEVGTHLAACELCRAEAEEFRASLDLLPYASPSHQPPAHVKRQLLARVAATAAPPRRPAPAWPRAAAAGALALVLLFGYLALDARARAAELSARLDQQAQLIAGLQAALEREQQTAVFIAAPQTLLRRLASPDRRASAVMYMQPGSQHAILVVSGLPQAQAGQVYQFWLARPGVQVPANTFDVGADGSALLVIDAPAPVNQYDQVMVTVEAGGGSQQPSQRVVLSGSLASALRRGPMLG